MTATANPISRPAPAAALLRVLWLLIAVLACLPWRTAQAQGERNAALVVGVSQYAAINGLRYAENDARRFAQKIGESVEFRNRVTLLVNTDAAKSGIERALEAAEAASRNAPLERFVLYFSGHGAEQLQGLSNEGFLLPHDFRKTSDYRDSAGKLNNDTHITKGWLSARLSAINAKRVIAIVDACYSGSESFGQLFFLNLVGRASTPAAQALVADAGSGNKGLGRQDTDGVRELSIDDVRVAMAARDSARQLVFLAASGPDQVAVEFDNLRAGIFTEALLAAIQRRQNGAFENSVVPLSVDTLYRDLQQEFSQLARTFNARQVPVAFPFPSRTAMSEGVLLQMPGRRVLAEQETGYRVRSGGVAVEVYVQNRLVAQGIDPAFRAGAGALTLDVRIPKTRFRRTMTLQGRPDVVNEMQFEPYGEIAIRTEWDKPPAGGANEPPKVSVYLNDQLLANGRTTLNLSDLLVGSHRLRMVTQGGTVIEREIEVRADSKLNIVVSVTSVAAGAAPDKKSGLTQGS